MRLNTLRRKRLVTIAIPIKRGLKVIHNFSGRQERHVTIAIPIKRGLKAHEAEHTAKEAVSYNCYPD